MGIIFDYSRLRGRIVEKCGTQGAFSKLAGISMVTLGKKLNGKIAFRNDEIFHIARILDIPNEELPAYFFAHDLNCG